MNLHNNQTKYSFVDRADENEESGSLESPVMTISPMEQTRGDEGTSGDEAEEDLVATGTNGTVAVKIRRRDLDFDESKSSPPTADIQSL